MIKIAPPNCILYPKLWMNLRQTLRYMKQLQFWHMTCLTSIMPYCTIPFYVCLGNTNLYKILYWHCHENKRNLYDGIHDWWRLLNSSQSDTSFSAGNVKINGKLQSLLQIGQQACFQPEYWCLLLCQWILYTRNRI